MPEQCTILLWFHVHLKQPATISEEPPSMFLYCNYHWFKKKKVFLKLEFEGVGCVQYVHACVYVSVSVCVHLAPS